MKTYNIASIAGAVIGNILTHNYGVDE